MGALGGGLFKTEEQRKKAEGRKTGAPSEDTVKICEKLEAIAKKKNTLLTSVALAYVMHKAPYVFPIVGGRNIEHLKGNIDALGLELSQEELNEIDDAVPFDVGFPMKFLFEFRGAQTYRTHMTGKDVSLLQAAVKLDTVDWPAPIKPHGL